MWHYNSDKTPAGPFDEEKTTELIRTGTITPKTLVWREGMSAWLPAEETELASHFAAVSPARDAAPTVPSSLPPASASATAPPAMNIAAALGFKDPTPLAKWLGGLLILSAIIAFAAVWSGALQWNLLQRIAHGAKLAPGEATSNDMRERIFGYTQAGIFIVTVIFFARWVYVVASNVRRFGASGLVFSPGWAVGYYFIPVVSLWKPYQAMKEIWKASHSPVNWQSHPGSSLLGYWWLFWILSCIVGQVAFRATLAARSADEFILSTSVAIASDVIDIPLGIIAYLLVRDLSAAQVRTAAVSA